MILGARDALGYRRMLGIAPRFAHDAPLGAFANRVSLLERNWWQLIRQASRREACKGGKLTSLSRAPAGPRSMSASL
jgi:hypothetical protein